MNLRDITQSALPLTRTVAMLAVAISFTWWVANDKNTIVAGLNERINLRAPLEDIARIDAAIQRLATRADTDKLTLAIDDLRMEIRYLREEAAARSGRPLPR